jgi:hypothetical protein
MMIHNLLKDLVFLAYLQSMKNPLPRFDLGPQLQNFHKNWTIFSDLKADASNFSEPYYSKIFK